MSQQIIMNENGMKDIDELSDICDSLLKFGIIHEERSNQVDEIMNFYILKKYATSDYDEEFESEKDDYDDIYEYVTLNYGTRAWYDTVMNLSEDEIRASARIYRDIIFEVLYTDSCIDSEYILEKLENV